MSNDLKEILGEKINKLLDIFDENEKKFIKVKIMDNTVLDKYPTYFIEITAAKKIFDRNISERFVREIRQEVTKWAAQKRHGAAYVEATIPQEGFITKSISIRVSVR